MTKKESHRSFLISFTSSLFCLSVLGMSAVLLVKPMEAPLQQDPVLSSVYIPQEQDSLAVLVVGVRDEVPEPFVPMTYMLIRMDPKKGSIPVATFPGNTAMVFRGKPCTLASLYVSDGISAVRQSVLETFGIQVDRHAYIPLSGFENIVNLIGNTSMFIPREIRLTQRHGSSGVTIGSSGEGLLLSKGMQQIDGKKAAALAVSDDYNSVQERCSLLSALARDAINQHLRLIRSDIAERLFEEAINFMDTDISFVDYVDRRRAVEFMTELKQNPATAIIPELSESSAGVLVVSPASREVLLEQFGE